jgi:hypothetical protein
MNTLDFDEVKTLGAPFEKAEIHVSLRNKTVTLLLLVPGQKGNHPALDFQLDGDEDWQQVGTELTVAASHNGLLRTNSTVAVLNLDSGPAACQCSGRCSTSPRMMRVSLNVDAV